MWFLLTVAHYLYYSVYSFPVAIGAGGDGIEFLIIPVSSRQDWFFSVYLVCWCCFLKEKSASVQYWPAWDSHQTGWDSQSKPSQLRVHPLITPGDSPHLALSERPQHSSGMWEVTVQERKRGYGARSLWPRCRITPSRKLLRSCNPGDHCSHYITQPPHRDPWR